MIKLSDDRLLERRAYIDGQWIETESTTDVVNPATAEVIAKVANCGVATMQEAIDAAAEAQPAWAAKTAKERSTILLKWQQLMVDNQIDLGIILNAEMGKPIAEATGEIAYGASFIQWFAEEGRRVYGDTIPGHQPDKRILVLRQAIGVVGAITPWNFPNAMLARKAGPALAAGCTFVARPAQLTPLSATAMAVLAERAGVPAGVFNIVTGDDASALGKELCENPLVKKLSFTGSTRVGSILMQQSAKDIKKLSLELGGNAPFIVFDDADIDKAVEGVMIAKYRNGGQTCVCANRIYVQDGVYDAFAVKLIAATENLKVGNGADAGVTIGPLIDQAAVDKVQSHIDDAVAQGATIATGGAAHVNGGTFYSPTVLTNVTQEMLIANEETFGPVAALLRFSDEDEVVQRANDTEFGLASYFYSQNLSRVWRVMEALEYGMVGVNTGLISTAEAPFGGVKASGLGREGSKYGIDDYMELKYCCISI